MTPPPIEEITPKTPVKLYLSQVFYIIASVVSITVAIEAFYNKTVGEINTMHSSIDSLRYRIKVIEDLQNKGHR